MSDFRMVAAFLTTGYKQSLLRVNRLISLVKTHSLKTLSIAPLCSVMLCANTAVNAMPINEKMIKRDFMRVVMSAEFGGRSKFGRSVKKYGSTVRFAVINHAKKDRRQAVRSFVWSLPDKVEGLNVSVVSDPNKANFRVHVVDRSQYARVIRRHVYKDVSKPVRGQCFVRVVSDTNRKNIGSSDVVIVSDGGEKLFQRCMVEEILQGLGPLADRGDQDLSIFNSASKHASFTIHDQILMNILYDPRVKPGMSKSQVAKILPKVLQDCLIRLKLASPQS